MLRGVRAKHSEMPIPTRSAPRPPGSSADQRGLAWSNNASYGSVAMQPKKKPPPRPPPPRIRRDTQNHLDHPKKPNRPTELLTNLFGRKTSKQSQINVAFAGQRAHPTVSERVLDESVSLIDLSPPRSPTFTTRSSSDGVSVDSFGSDGNSNPSAFTSSGNTSQTESAFEDDFDFFGSLAKTSVHHDPWKRPVDPFSPLRNASSSNGTVHVGDASFFAYNGEPAPLFPPPPASVTSMPTIIRARPPKPPAPKVLPTNLAPTVANFTTQSSESFGSSLFSDSANWSSSFPEDRSSSADRFPPMPTIPPPAPPAEYFEEVVEKGKAVALYDYQSSHPGDLQFKKDDVVALTGKIGDEWLEGRLGNNCGMFPANFVKILAPLPGMKSNVVTALYTFHGEVWEDLPFEEGAKITVLSKISNEWLYGECMGKKGQFPANFIDRVPYNLPTHS